MLRLPPIWESQYVSFQRKYDIGGLAKCDDLNLCPVALRQVLQTVENRGLSCRHLFL